MKNDKEIIESLITGGIIGAGIGALITENSREGLAIGSIIGAAILGTYKANEKAKETHIPFIIEENGILYQINEDGSKLFLRELEKPKIKIEKNFKLL